jgi:hypothetical protein
MSKRGEDNRVRVDRSVIVQQMVGEGRAAAERHASPPPQPAAEF